MLLMSHVCKPQTGDEKTRESSKRKWFEDLKKAKEQELEKLGLDPSQVRAAAVEEGHGDVVMLGPEPMWESRTHCK